MENRLSQIVSSRLLAEQEFAPRRDEIARRIMSRSPFLSRDNFTAIENDDLARLFVYYDELFFDSCFASIFEDLNNQLTFRLSKRMTSAGGTTSYHKSKSKSGEHRHFEIAVSTTLLFNTNYDLGSGVRVCGVRTSSRLDALLRIFEHELIHLAELCLWEKSSCAAKQFKSIVYRLFGHTESNHQLMTPAESAKAELGIEIGDRVGFEFEGQTLAGYVNRIRRRATVLVEHRNGERFEDGKKYLRFYVPVKRLVRVA